MLKAEKQSRKICKIVSLCELQIGQIAEGMIFRLCKAFVVASPL